MAGRRDRVMGIQIQSFFGNVTYMYCIFQNQGTLGQICSLIEFRIAIKTIEQEHYMAGVHNLQNHQHPHLSSVWPEIGQLL